jgi:hypothetical protein
MTTIIPREVLLLAFAIGLSACDAGSPSGPTPPSPITPSAPGVTAIAPSTGSTVRPTPVVISGTGFLPGAAVTIGVVAQRVVVVDSTTINAIAPAHAAGPADVVVTNPGGAGGTLAGTFAYSVEEPITVTAGADAVAAGGELSVSWTAPGARAGDWIALFRLGSSYEDDWYGLTNGATSGSLTSTVPTVPGLYEFRYLVGHSSFLDVARSGPVTVR